MAKFFKCSAVDGGGAGAVDAILTADIEDTNSNWDGVALVVGGGMFSVYEYDSTCAEAESLPDIVIPDDNATGTGAWKRKGGYFPGSAVMRKNLVVKTTSITAIDIDADLLDLEDATGRIITLRAVDVSLAITASGANGLDTGSEAAATAYNVFMIGDDDHNAAGLLSVSAAPTLPSGYTHWRKVGEVYNDSGGDFVLFQRDDDDVWFEDPQAVYTNQTLTVSYVQHSLPSAVPSMAMALELEVGSASASIAIVPLLSPDNTTRYERAIYNSVAGSTNQGPTGGHGPVQLHFKHLGATSIYARANSTGPAASQNLHVWGYRKAV